MIGGRAKGELVPLGPFEPEVHIVFPGKTNPAVHLHGLVGRARIDLGQAGLGNRRRPGRIFGAGVKRIGRVPDQGPGRFDLADHFGGHVFEGLEGGDRPVKLFTDFGVLDRHVERLLGAPETVGGEGNAGQVLKPGQQFPAFSGLAEKTGDRRLLEPDFVHPSRPIKNVQRSDGQARGVPLDQHQTDALFALSTGTDGHDQDVGYSGKGDEHLGTAQRIAVAFFPGLEGNAGGVQAIAGFEKSQCADGVA